MNNYIFSYSKIFLLSMLSFMAGVVVSEFLLFDIFLIFCLSLLFLFLILISKNNNFLRIIFLVALFFIFGFWRFQVSLPDYSNPHNIFYYNNNQVDFVAKVVSINQRISYQQLVLEVITINNTSVRGKVIATTALYPEYKFGDHLRINCKLSEPVNYNDFDYGRYLSGLGIYSVCSFPHISLLDESENDLTYKIFSFIFFIKNKLNQSLAYFIPEPEASLLQAMIFGVTGGLPKDVSNILSNVGLSHAVAISGMHMVIITIVIMQLSIALGLIRQKSFWVASIVVVFYIGMIGFLPSAIRGAIMALLFLYAQKIGRLSYSINALLLSAFIMLLFNPKLLLYDVGFQLSFMAVLGLIYLLPILKNKFKSWSDLGQIKNIIIVTLSAQIMTQPLVIFYFHKISLISLLANVLVLPITPFLMIWVFINSVVGLFSKSLGYLMGYVSYLTSHYMIFISAYLNNWPMAYLDLQIDSVFITAIFYFFIIIFIFKNKDSMIDS